MNQKVGRLDISVNDVVVVNDLETVANLHQNVLNLVLRKASSFRFDIGFKILLAILKEKIQVFGGFSRFVELDNVLTLEFHENLDLSPHYFFIFDAVQGNCLDG